MLGAVRIFLSHASEQKTEADSLAIALGARGHNVFLDSEDLPPGSDYQSRIEQAIGACDLFCFLISAASIAPKRFTLSELNVARRRWPNPASRVLPIMVEKVPMESVPPYLRAVSILQPEGDLVADVLSAIEQIRPPKAWQSLRILAGAGAAVLLLAGFLLYPRVMSKFDHAQPQVATETPQAPSGSSGLNIPVLDTMRNTLARFVVYMKGVGFRQLDDNVTVNLYSKEFPLPGELREQSDTVNAFYFDRGIYVHFSMSSDMSVFLREFAHHALLETAGANKEAGNSAVESALADYYPASFFGSPLIGEGLGPLFQLSTTYIRRLDNKRSYTDVPDESHARGEVWAGALWMCRQELGQATVDTIPAQAWTAISAKPRGTNFESAFGVALASATGPAGACFAREIERRHLPR